MPDGSSPAPPVMSAGTASRASAAPRASISCRRLCSDMNTSNECFARYTGVNVEIAQCALTNLGNELFRVPAMKWEVPCCHGGVSSHRALCPDDLTHQMP